MAHLQAGFAFEARGDEATTAARSMMDKMVKNGVADVHQLGLMLKLWTRRIIQRVAKF